jgi:metallophosphoesterase (TIGR03768 family)
MNKSDHKDKLVILNGSELQLVHKPNRRDFIKYSAGAAGFLYLSTLPTGCGGSSAQVAGYAIDSKVVKTTERVLSYTWPTKLTSPNPGAGLCPTELWKVSEYSKYGYGNYTYSSKGLEVKPRYDLMPSVYTNASPVRLKKFANFFTISDIHITDKEAPNQLIYIQQDDAENGAPVTSIYSPVMLYTTHVLDAAVQTINALHEKNPFTFGLSLGDTCNSTQYNELRWYIDVLDGKAITPSSGAHLGATSIDYQKPYKTAGLNPDIAWYQTLGNHDHFCIGSIPVDADPTLKIRKAYISSNVWRIGDVLKPNDTFPCVYDTSKALKEATYYTGVLDGRTATGEIIDAGVLSTQPVVAADANRRSLLRTEWIEEFFNTSTAPAGHGFNLVDKSMGSGFACYSFVPSTDIPLKVIVLDDTQSENDGSHDIHGHGFLDETRWKWLQTELAAGQANNQLMIIAAHVPIAVSPIGSEVEWWETVSPKSGTKDPYATMTNAVSLTELVAKLQSTPNLILWASGHRHFNTVKAFKPPTAQQESNPEMGFWQVETSSLRDDPQQFRTFEIYLNDDYTVSIVTINVDPAVAAGTPAETSRKYAIAAQQIVQTELLSNAENVQNAQVKPGVSIPVESMDPTRKQDGTADGTIFYGKVAGVQYCPSYNAELFKQLSPAMIAVMKQKFPASA